MFNHPNKNIESAYVGEGMIVADFGAGVGHHLTAIANRVGEGGTIYAIEIQKDLLSRLENEARKEKLTNVHPILSDLERENGSTLADRSVDRVLIINTLFQIENKKAVFREANRILKSTGKLCLVDWQGSFGHIGPHPDQVIGKEDALNLAKEAGFKLENEFSAGEHHYGLLFRQQ